MLQVLKLSFNPHCGSLAKCHTLTYDGRMAPQIRSCRQCNEPITAPGPRSYCSRRCSGLATRVLQDRECPGCGTTFRPRVGEQRYCSKPCADAGLIRHGVPLENCCEQCGVVFRRRQAYGRRPKFCSLACFGLSIRVEPKAAACSFCGKVRQYEAKRPPGKYCSLQCAGAARKLGDDSRVCRQCGRDFRLPLHRARHNPGLYCSRSCANEGKRRQAELSCERCGRSFAVAPHRAASRRFCSRDCSGKAGLRGKPPIHLACPSCGRDQRVYESTLKGRAGRYCSLSCRSSMWRARRVALQCHQCRRGFSVQSSQANRGRRFCSRRCARLAQAPREYRCKACRTSFLSRAWRKPQFCSLSCTNKGRHRERRPEDQARIARILELHGQGVKAPAIAEQLRDERVDWLLSAAGVRQIIHRERAAVGAL